MASVLTVRHRRELDPQRFHLTDRDTGYKADEEKKKKTEQPEAAAEEAPVHPGRSVHVPARAEKIAVERRHDDDETLHPHARENGDGTEKEDPRVRSEAS